MKALKFSVVLGFICLLLVGCASKQSSEGIEQKGLVKTQILEHKGTALGINILPSWIETYVMSGISGLEQMPEYSDFYCFVGEATAKNLNAGKAWVNGFDVPQTIARTVESRVKATFNGAEAGSPEDNYGAYFENVVKTASNTKYSGTRKISDWWVLYRRYDPDDKKKFSDDYLVYILYTIPRELLDSTILGIMDDVSKKVKLTEEQKSAVDNVKKMMKQDGLFDDEGTTTTEVVE